MGEIIILEKEKADALLSLGFKYTVKEVDKKEVYVFIQTDDLMKYVSSKFDNQSFIVRKNVCF